MPNEKQQKFLEVLFEEAGGDFVKAKKLAGYSSNTPTRQIVENLEDEILQRTKKFLLFSGTKAAYTLKDILDNPVQMGNKDRLAAARDILDRVGIVKTDKVEVKSDTPLFVLPEKKTRR